MKILSSYTIENVFLYFHNEKYKQAGDIIEFFPDFVVNSKAYTTVRKQSIVFIVIETQGSHVA